MKCFILFNIEGASVCIKYKVVSASYLSKRLSTISFVAYLNLEQQHNF